MQSLYNVFLVIGVIALMLLVVDNIHKKFRIEKKKIITLYLHILIAISLGVLLKVVGSPLATHSESLLKIFVIILIFVTGLFIKELILYKTIKPIVSNYLKILYIVSILFFISAIINNYSLLWNLLILFILIIFWIGFQGNNEKEKQYQPNIKSDLPILSFEDLFPSRKKEYIRIFNYLLNMNTADPYAVAITGSWGEGKTSFVNVLKQGLENKNSEIIFIQPMILDSREKLLEYVFNQVEVILTNNGIYTGKGSAYSDYFNLLVKFVNFKHLNLMNSFFNGFSQQQKEDLREYKLKLEQNLEQLVSDNKRIYILVDDLDRVEEDTVYSILTFIKEIVDLKGVTIIFIVDYKNIISNRINNEYLEKFINKKFELSKVENSEIFNHYIDKILPHYNLQFINGEVNTLKDNCSLYLSSIEENINKLIQTKETIIDEQKGNINDNNIFKELADIKNNLSEFKEKCSNARYVKKIISEVKEIFDFIENDLINEIVNENQDIEISELIFKLSIFKTIYKEEFEELIKLGDFSRFLSENQNSFIFSLLNEKQSSIIIFDNERILNEKRHSFYDSIIFSNKISKDIFLKVKNKHEEILKELDNNEKSVDAMEIRDIRMYVEAINYVHFGEESDDILFDRIYKLTGLVITMAENSKVDLIDIFKLLETAQRNKLINAPIFLEALLKLMETSNLSFNSKNEETVAFNLLEKMDFPLIVGIQNDLKMLIWMLNIEDNKFSLSNLKSNFEKALKLKALNEELIALIPEKKLSSHSGDFISEFEHIIDYIYSKLQENNNTLFLRSFQFYKSNVNHFIKVMNLKENITLNLSEVRIDNEQRFELTNKNHTISEIIKDVDDLEEFLVNNNRIEQKHFNFFRYTLNNVEYINNNEIKEDMIKKLKRIFTILQSELYGNEELMDKYAWHYCMLKLTEIEVRI
ncbi:P-loop NTPase fold protein [Bacillus sp. es.034]|uniref:P-loop NTPase fold protein n=1 Tax=Bacillus sp. es.034 TaxID=1761763 RepID=UPI000C00E627|nr:P-loop NTPase fold protein [Bacillus sp. es.034]PFG07767.1 KAP-like P-loop domain-containing protein [Bacillus sp. es.034]